MKFPIKAVKLAGVLAIALGATVPATLISTPAAAHEMDRGRDSGHDGGPAMVDVDEDVTNGANGRSPSGDLPRADRIDADIDVDRGFVLPSEPGLAGR